MAQKEEGTMNTQMNKESSGTERAVTAAFGARHRIQDLASAISYLTGLPGFAAMDARVRRETESLVAESETASFPRLQAFEWFDKYAEAFLGLVTDLPSWDSYRILLCEGLYPESYKILYGGLNLIPVSRQAVSLETRLRQRNRHWQQRSSAKLAASGGQARRELPTPLARNLESLRLACWLSNERLAEETGLEKKLILGHILHGKSAHPKTLKTYAETFTRLLERSITAGELLAD
jgi:hypothetical protein